MEPTSKTKIEQDLGQYAEHMTDRMKLGAAEKAADVIGVLITSVFVGLMAILLLLCLNLATAAALKLCMPEWAAYLVVAGIDLLLMVVALLLRKPLLVYPITDALLNALLGREVSRNQVDVEKMRLELETERDKMRLYGDIKGLLLTEILEWALKVIVKWRNEAKEKVADMKEKMADFKDKVGEA